MKKLLIIGVCLGTPVLSLVSSPSTSIDEKSEKRIQFSGYVQPEFFFDSRQMVASADGHEGFYPKNKALDVLGNDSNSVASHHFNAFRTRLITQIWGPPVHNAESYGKVEVDFLGSSGTENILRMRHAFFRLEWPCITFLAGQTWHPVYTPDCCAQVVAGNSGEPFELATRNPQARVTFQWQDQSNKLRFTAAALSQTARRATGPIGTSGTYIRNAFMPEFVFGVEGECAYLMAGCFAGVKKYRPRLVSNANYTDNHEITSALFSCYAGSTICEKIVVNTRISYLQNGNDLNTIGGYAVSCVEGIMVDEESMLITTDRRSYANLPTMAAWFQIYWKHWISPGIFIGGTKNISPHHTIIESITELTKTESTVYERTPGIAGVLRIAPRLWCTAMPLNIGIECEWTRAWYGSLTTSTRTVKNSDGEEIGTINYSCGTPRCNCPVDNVRLLFVLQYHF